MADYLVQIEDAKAEIARLKGEKEAFEQRNPPDDADEDELARWNYARDLEQQIKEIRSENRNALAELRKLEKAAARKKATEEDKKKFNAAQGKLQPVFDQIARIGAELVPYEKIKGDLAVARARFRDLTAKFVDELKVRCEAMNVDEKQTLVLGLFAQDLQAGLDSAVVVKRQAMICFAEGLRDKYAIPLTEIQHQREQVQTTLAQMMKKLNYS